MNRMPQATPPTALALADWSILFLSAQQFRQPNLMLYLTYFMCVTVIPLKCKGQKIKKRGRSLLGFDKKSSK